MKGGTIRNVQIVTPGEEIRSGAIQFSEDGTIAAVGELDGSGDVLWDGEGELFAFPGFIDIHTHGAAGRDTSHATHEAIETIAEAKLKEGVTTFLPTTWTASREHLRDMAKAAAAYRENQRFARAPFLHIEGPYLNPAQAGAQNPSHMRPPDIEEIRAIDEICPVKLVSLAVELDGGLEFISEMRRRGIVTSAAHSDANYSEFRAARRAGLGHLTHFCNQMSGLHHRDVGLVGAGLLDDEVRIELICDTIHLCEDMLELVFRHRSSDQLMLITDSIAASHFGDGEYELGETRIIVKDGAARIPEGNLAGSTLKFNDALKNVAGITGLPLEELARTTGFNQARSLGFTDRGEIRNGLLGDVVLLDQDFEVEAVFLGGELRYRR